MAQEKESRWKISTAGLVIGIILGLFYFAIADAARIGVGLLNSLAQSSGSNVGLSLSSNLFDFVNSGLYLALVAALIIVKIAHRTIKGPLEVRGPLKVALGALTGVFYYFIFAGGVISFVVGLTTPVSGSLVLDITLIITLALLELSAVFKILQGVFEFRDGRREARQVPSEVEPAPEVPPPPSDAAPENPAPQGISA